MTVKPPAGQAVSTNQFINFETAPVHPLEVDPSGTRLALANLPASRVEIFDITGATPRSVLSVGVGLDPVSVRWRNTNELWVVAQLSDAVDIIDLAKGLVMAQVSTGDAPADVVFAGNPIRAFVSSAGDNRLDIFDPTTHRRLGFVPVAGNRPKALAVGLGGQVVCVAINESGNATTIVAPFIDQLGHRQGPGVADLGFAPNLGQNPAPNASESPTGFLPSLNPALTNPPPPVPIIVRKDSQARWRDGDGRDWTEFVSGTNAAFSGRLPGWDLPDRDLAFVNTSTLAVQYATGLMNICSALAVNPVTGSIAVVGTDASNEVRFEPRLNGVFIQSRLALVNSTNSGLSTQTKLNDLNPHLSNAVTNLPASRRAVSLGDPRAVVWNDEGTRLYVAGQGSANVAVYDSNGERVGEPILLGAFAGPAGLALDPVRRRLFVLNRFSAELATVNLESGKVISRTRIADPTPEIIQRGRRVFYDTQLFSGLGQAACASCHPEGRFDRLAWDLGTPAGEWVTISSHQDSPAGDKTLLRLHPMKGPMVTQTLQDILGHEPFHWRADRPGIEDFGPTFTNLQAADRVPTAIEFEDFKAFLGSLTFPPNPYRNIDNSLPSRMVLNGQLAFGRDKLDPGQPLSAGNAQRGLQLFRDPAKAACATCHTLPTGLGPNAEFGGAWRSLGFDTNNHASIAVVHLDPAGRDSFKVTALRSVAEKLGFDLRSSEGSAGFGLLHDGSVDTLPRFLHDRFRVSADQDQADLIAFLFAFTGSDLPAGDARDIGRPPGPSARDVPAGVGQQVLLDSATQPDAFSQFLALARSSRSRVELIVQQGNEGWWYDPTGDRFLGNRSGMFLTLGELSSQARSDAPLLAQLVATGTGYTRAIDRDGDGFRDGDELAAGSDPTDPSQTPLTLKVDAQLTLRVPLTEPEAPAELLWRAQPGVQYQIQTRNGLDQPWASLGKVIGNRFFDTASRETEFAGARFYRLLGEAAPQILSAARVHLPSSDGPTLNPSPAVPAVILRNQDIHLVSLTLPTVRRRRASPAGVLVITNFHRFIFSNLDLRLGVFPSLDFSRGSAVNGHLEGAQLTGGSLLAGRFAGANFSGARLDATDLRDADFTGAKFGGAQLRLVRASQAMFKSAILTDADLRGADFGDANLSVADLRRADLRGASFDHCNLDLTDLRQTRRDAATRFDAKAERIWHLANEGGAGENLRDLDLSFAVLNGADLHGAIFGRANLTGAELLGCDLRGCVLNQAQLEGALLHFTRVDGTTVFSTKFQKVWAVVNNAAGLVNLRGSNLDGAWMPLSFIDGVDFTGASLRRCSFTEVSAEDANFTSVQFTSGFASHGDFQRAIFTNANLTDTDFSSANLSHALLNGANLTRVTFRGADLDGADLTGAVFNQTTMPDGSVRNR